MDQEARSPLLSMQGERNPSFQKFPSERLLRLNKLKHFHLHSPFCSNSQVIRKMQMLLSDTKNQYQSHFKQPCDSQKERINKHYHTNLHPKKTNSNRYWHVLTCRCHIPSNLVSFPPLQPDAQIVLGLQSGWHSDL